MKAIPFIIALKNEIPRKNLSKEMKDQYNENCKTLTRETKDDTKKWKDNPCS